jgi:uncharacterized protein with HEPN domain
VKRDYRDYLEDILAAIDDSAEFTRDISFEAFIQDRKTVNAVVRSLEVLGEAARRIPDHLRAEVPDVPWKYMAGMRNKLIHEYCGVDLRSLRGTPNRALGRASQPLMDAGQRKASPGHFPGSDPE